MGRGRQGFYDQHRRIQKSLFGLLGQVRGTGPMNDWTRLLASGLLEAPAGALAFVAVAAKLARAASFGEKQEVSSVRAGAVVRRTKGVEGNVNPVVHGGYRAGQCRQNRVEITPETTPLTVSTVSDEYSSFPLVPFVRHACYE